MQGIAASQSTSQKRASGDWYKRWGSFSVPAVKAAHSPTQARQKRDLSFLSIDLSGFLFKSISKSLFLCLCGAIFAQGAPSFGFLNNVLQNII